MLPSANPGMQQARGDPSRPAKIVRPSLRRRPGRRRIIPSGRHAFSGEIERIVDGPEALLDEGWPTGAVRPGSRASAMEIAALGPRIGRVFRRDPVVRESRPGEAMVVDRASGHAASWDTRSPRHVEFDRDIRPVLDRSILVQDRGRIPRNLPIRRFFRASQSMCQYIQLSRWRGHTQRTCSMETGLMPRMIRRHRRPVAFREDCMIPRSGGSAHGSDRAMRRGLDLAEFERLTSA